MLSDGRGGHPRRRLSQHGSVCSLRDHPCFSTRVPSGISRPCAYSLPRVLGLHCSEVARLSELLLCMPVVVERFSEVFASSVGG